MHNDDMTHGPMNPTINNIRRWNGVAGQVGVTAAVTYPGEDASAVTFTGSVYGGPVVMVTGNNGEHQTFVTDPGRFGTFGDDPAAWARRFFA